MGVAVLDAVTRGGTDGNDDLSGGQGNDILEGAFGVDVLSGGVGSDQFVFAFGDGGANTETADLVTDYEMLDDEIGLTFPDLSITDGAGGAEVAIGFTGEVLATFQGTLASELDSGEFVLI